MDEDELNKAKRCNKRFLGSVRIGNPFATTVEDSEELANLAWKYMSLYKGVVAENG